MSRSDTIMAEERFPISKKGFKMQNHQMVLSVKYFWALKQVRRFTLKTHYLRCESLHSSPKFASKTKNIQAGNA